MEQRVSKSPTIPRQFKGECMKIDVYVIFDKNDSITKVSMESKEVVVKRCKSTGCSFAKSHIYINNVQDLINTLQTKNSI